MTDPVVSPARSWSAEIALKIQFYDLDPMQVVWHGNYARYFEQARCALLDSIGYNYPEMKASGYAWPVIDMHVRYLQPATFGQDVIVRAEIVEWEHRLRMQYLIRDASTSLRLTKGSTVQVAVSLESKLMCLQSPSILFEKLGVPEPL
ncbi:MAG: acyl-CoA thioesterase [Gemmatimonadaceae bacterium]|jgi:acyl-CoA thioester hydrolase|nr:acyl-CoA thioesterase [Gemmatimonadaceae bacterium]